MPKQEFYTRCDELTLHVMRQCLWMQGCKRFEAVRELNRLSRGYFGIPAYEVKGKENVELLFKLILGRDFDQITTCLRADTCLRRQAHRQARKSLSKKDLSF